MKTIELKGMNRETGRVAAKNLRNKGQIPCVMYGMDAPLHFYADEVQLKSALWTPHVFIVKVDLGGNQTDTIIRDAQFHPVTDRVLHVDFMRVGNEPVELELPVKLTGTAPGVAAGGRLLQLLRKIKVKGIPGSLPDDFQVKVDGLELGKSIKVGEVESTGFQVLTESNVAIASVKIPRQVVEVAKVEGDAAAPAEGDAAAAKPEGDAGAKQPGKEKDK